MWLLNRICSLQALFGKAKVDLMRVVCSCVQVARTRRALAATSSTAQALQMWPLRCCRSRRTSTCQQYCQELGTSRQAAVLGALWCVSPGIVVVGGGPKYTPAAFGCVYFIRRTGSQLPIEVWAPPHEPIPPAVAADFAAMGNVSVRSLGDVFPSAAHDNMRDRRFLAKQLAILASQFREVLLLDADNIPLQDPAFLFEEPLYTQHGLLMWPDFWKSEAKPGAWDALGIPPKLRPPGSHESGQVVLDKQRAWKPLLLAVYLNMRGDVFYPLFSVVGQGDKETLPYAWLGLGYGRYGLVQHQVLALGVMTQENTHHGTAMLQRTPDGVPMFLHAHMPKIDVPRDDIKLPPAAPRQWEVLTGEITAFPPQLNVTQFAGKAQTYEVLNAVAGYDIEVEALQLRRYLRCQPAWVACCLQA